VVCAIDREQRPGYLEIHRDMVERTIEVPAAIRDGRRTIAVARSNPRKVREAARETAERLRAARRPVVIAGIEAYRFKAERKLVALVERLGVPVLTTMLSKGAVPMDHPLYMGVYMGGLSPRPIARRVERADLVLDLGTPPTDIGGGSHPLPPERVIHAVDRRVDASFHSYNDVDLRDFLAALLRERLPRFAEKVVHCDNLPRPARGWLDAVARGLAAAATAAAKPIEVAEVLLVLNRFLAGRKGFVVVADSGDVLFAGLDVRIGGRGAYFAPGFYASMGFSVPAAMGIEIGCGKRPIVLCGDGAFQMTGPEIAQSRVNGTRPIVLVMNNGGWGIFRPVLKKHALLEIPPWPYAELARLWGGDGVRVTTAPELWQALSDAGRSPRFALIEVVIGRDDLSPLSQKYIRSSARQGAKPRPTRTRGGSRS
jgi:TPP-dependent 2-oxoacid decarboxylase